MRILHIADLHLGVSFKSVRGKDVGKNVNDNILRNVEEAFTYAVNNKIDIVVLAGDIFNNLYVSLNYTYALASKLNILYKNDIPIIIIAGNHDSPRVRGIHSPLTILSQLHIDKVYYQESLPKEPLKMTVEDGCLGVVPIPYIHPSERRGFEDSLSQLIKKLYRKMERCDYKLLTTHYDVKGAKYSQLDPYSNSFYNIIRVSPEVFQPDLFDYIALGHIHLHQSIKGYENILYSGSVERVSFGEAFEEKGFLDIDLNDSHPHIKFVRTSPIEMYVTPFLDVAGDNPVHIIIQHLDSIKLENTLVRIRVKVDSVAWASIRDSMGKLDDYLLHDRKVLGYRVDPLARGFPVEIGLVGEDLKSKNWLLKSLSRYVDSLVGISSEDKEDMKRLIHILFNKKDGY